MLLQWSVFAFEVWPMNIHEVDHTSGSDWARKEILGASVFREWTGENDELIQVRGRLFPLFFAGQPSSGRLPAGARLRNNTRGSGLDTIQSLDNMRLAGHVDVLMRGDGYFFGWFVVERLSRQ